MNRTSLSVLIAVAVVIVGVWLWAIQPPVLNVPAENIPGTIVRSDTSAAISSDLNSITIETPDFTNIDSDVSSL